MLQRNGSSMLRKYENNTINNYSYDSKSMQYPSTAGNRNIYQYYLPKLNKSYNTSSNHQQQQDVNVRLKNLLHNQQNNFDFKTHPLKPNQAKIDEKVKQQIDRTLPAGINSRRGLHTQQGNNSNNNLQHYPSIDRLRGNNHLQKFGQINLQPTSTSQIPNSSFIDNYSGQNNQYFSSNNDSRINNQGIGYQNMLSNKYDGLQEKWREQMSSDGYKREINLAELKKQNIAPTLIKFNNQFFEVPGSSSSNIQIEEIMNSTNWKDKTSANEMSPLNHLEYSSSTITMKKLNTDELGLDESRPDLESSIEDTGFTKAQENSQNKSPMKVSQFNPKNENGGKFVSSFSLNNNNNMNYASQSTLADSKQQLNNSSTLSDIDLLTQNFKPISLNLQQKQDLKQKENTSMLSLKNQSNKSLNNSFERSQNEISINDNFHQEQQKRFEKLQQTTMKQDQIFKEHLQKVTIPQTLKNHVNQSHESRILEEDYQKAGEFINQRKQQHEDKKREYLRTLQSQMKAKRDIYDHERHEKELQKSQIRLKQVNNEQIDENLKLIKKGQQQLYKKMLDDQWSEQYNANLRNSQIIRQEKGQNDQIMAQSNLSVIDQRDYLNRSEIQEQQQNQVSQYRDRSYYQQ
eukprot:403376178